MRPLVIAIVLLATLTGCRSLGYVTHVAHGQAALLAHRRPIDRVVSDPHTPEPTRKRLLLARAARRFASDKLGLPDNRSYTYFVQLDRPWVAWNVFATPEFSVDAVVHCFPIAGCVAYRGYFRKALAEREAAREKAGGRDVALGEVPAYSTLGWFADPLLSSMLSWDDDTLAGTIFHELAHQKVYVRDDSSFNESYATFVEEEGVREWRASRGLPAPDATGDALDHAFTTRVLDLRQRLKNLYSTHLDDEARRVAKAEEFEVFRGDYLHWRAATAAGNRRYDRWMAKPLNNATLLPFGLYDTWTPSFAALFAQVGGDWPAFFRQVAALGAKTPAERNRALEALKPTAAESAVGRAP